MKHLKSNPDQQKFKKRGRWGSIEFVEKLRTWIFLRKKSKKGDGFFCLLVNFSCEEMNLEKRIKKKRKKKKKEKGFLGEL